MVIEERDEPSAQSLTDLLVILVDADPSSLIQNDTIDNDFLSGLRNLLRLQLRIKRQPDSGLPMVYPIKITAENEQQHGFVHRPDFWSTSEGAALAKLNLSVTQLISRQNSVQSFKNLLSQLARQQEDNSVGRFKRSLKDLSVRTGSRVFLEVENSQCSRF